MYAVEFETVAQNGIITIPADYAEFLSQPVKVVLIMDDTSKQRKIAHMQQLIDQGLASGISNETMETIKQKALSQFNANAAV